MGRASNRKKERRENNRTPISSHEMKNKNLVPPINKMEKLALTSWADERMPEYIWVALIICLNEREEAINKLKWITRYFCDLEKEKRPESLSITDLSKLENEIFEGFLDFTCNYLELRESLSPLYLFENLPNKNKWRKYLNANDEENEWRKLYVTVANCIDHQSLESTDCRWFIVHYLLVKGQLRLQNREQINLIINYPKVENEERARGFIRSNEVAMSSMPSEETKGDWIQDFWQQGMKDTPCWKLGFEPNLDPTLGINRENLTNVKSQLKKYFTITNTTTKVDAKHDTVFGLAMYCLEILDELSSHNNNTTIISRLGLRTITECYISLAYLCHKDNEDLWLAYRNYGSGQAKLTSLKLEEIEGTPKYANIETLKALANEDKWEEFLNINLGHWEKSNLRSMSNSSGVKKTYDTYYDWTSNFSHGQWAAVRNSTFDTCGNPMHRLYRIPKEKPELNDVTEDAKILTNKILDLVNKNYSEVDLRLS